MDGARTVNAGGAGSDDGGDAIAAGEVLRVTDAEAVGVAGEESLRAVAVSGRPHGEPIDQRGPFVF